MAAIVPSFAPDTPSTHPDPIEKSRTSVGSSRLCQRLPWCAGAGEWDKGVWDLGCTLEVLGNFGFSGGARLPALGRALEARSGL